MSELVIRNRQRLRSLNVPLLRRVAQHVLEQEMDVLDYEIGFHLVSSSEMARVNERFLAHEGSTDVITFDHGGSAERLHGEIFISIPDAVRQAHAFNTTWQSEVIRYAIHGLLHLRGCDDIQPDKRREMKRQENRLVRSTGSKFPIGELGRPGRPTPKTRHRS